MPKKKYKKKSKADVSQAKAKTENQDMEKGFSEEAEKFFKRILRTMSWIVGVTFAAVLILPQFNSTLLDQITQVLFYIGFVTLIVFILIELVSNSVKRLIDKFIILRK